MSRRMAARIKPAIRRTYNSRSSIVGRPQPVAPLGTPG
jgi:hypothetical protein